MNHIKNSHFRILGGLLTALFLGIIVLAVAGCNDDKNTVADSSVDAAPPKAALNSVSLLPLPPELPADGFHRPFTATGYTFVLPVSNAIYPNLVITSTAEINIVVETITHTISLHIEPLTGSAITSTQLTVFGLLPKWNIGLTNTNQFFLHQDGYFMSLLQPNEKGEITWTQDVTRRHHVYLLPIHGTINIWGRDDPRDDVVSKGIGIWLDATTCQLTQDISNDFIVIQADNLTLDGNHHNITGSGWGMGVYLYNRTGVTVKNCVITNFGEGILQEYGGQNRLISNTVKLNPYGIYYYDTSNNTIADNDVGGNAYNGVFIAYGSSNTISHNTVNPGGYSGCVEILWSNHNVISDNIANNANNNVGFSFYGSSDNAINRNTANNNWVGFWFGQGSNNNNLSACTVDSDNMGIGVSDGVNNSIKNCTIQGDANGWTGIFLAANCSETAITNNTVLNYINSYGIHLYGGSYSLISRNIVRSNLIGMFLYAGSSDNTISNNTIQLNNIGIAVTFRSDNNTISGNEISSNGEGILIEDGSSFNICKNNNITDSYWGLFIGDVTTVIYHNNIYGNTDRNIWASPPIQLSYFNSTTNRNEGNWWGHTVAPGFYRYGEANTPYDSNAANVVDSAPYLVKNGWLKGYAPGQPEDTTPPVNCSIQINADALATSSIAVNLTLAANDPESGVTEMHFSNDNINWTNWEPYLTSKNWTLTTGDGTKTVWVEYKNGAGLTTKVSDSIILDTIPPTKPVPLLPANNTYINTRTPTFSWQSAIDANALTYRLEISPSPDFSTLTLFKDELPTTQYSLLATESLSDGQPYWWRISARDIAGNQSVSSVAAFTVDATPPVITITSPESRDYLNIETLLTAFTVTDALSGVDKYYAYLDNTLINPANPINLSTLVLGAHTFQIIAWDKAGNQSIQSVTFQTVRPATAVTETSADIRTMLADPNITSSAKVVLQGALDILVGNNDGKANNGAIAKLNDGDLIAAFTKIWQAIRELKKAQNLGAPTIEVQRDLCNLTKELVRVRIEVVTQIYGTANPDVQWILQHDTAGVNYYNQTDYENAVKEFKLCQQKIAELDNQPPIITFIKPTNNQYLNTNQPEIVAVYVDILTAVKKDTVKVWLDGLDYTVTATITGADLRLVPPPLAEGMHTVKISVSDAAVTPNTAVVSVVFGIDLTPPTLNIDYPTEAMTWTNINQVYFENSYNDALSGINEGALQVLLNSVDITSVFTHTLLSAAYYPKFDTQDEINKFLVVYNALVYENNTLVVRVADNAGNFTIATRHFIVYPAVIEFPRTPPLKIGLEIISGNNQEGIVGRCTEQPLIVRAFNQDNHSQSYEGIQLAFEIIRGDGIFVRQNGDSTDTDAEGKASLHYLYGDKAGVNYVRVSVWSDSSVMPVEFHLEGYLPKIEITKPLNVERKVFPDGITRYALNREFDGLGDRLFVKVTDPRKNQPLKDVQVTWETRPGGMPLEGFFLPETQLTNEQGQTIFGFTSWGFIGSAVLKAYLPEFIDPASGEPLSDQLDLEIGTIRNQYLSISGGQAQIGVSHLQLANQLVVYFDKWENGNRVEGKVTFSVKSGDGVLSSNSPVPTVGGYAGVFYTFGNTATPQVIKAEVTVDGGIERVYFVLGIPEVTCVAENGFGQFVQMPCIAATNPFNITPDSPFRMEIKAPTNLGHLPVLAMNSINASGAPAANISGAIGSLNLNNIVLTQVEQNDRYVLYRSSKPMISTTDRLLPGEVLTGEPAPGYDVMQMTNFGTLMPLATFDDEIKILVRRATIKAKAITPAEDVRRLIYPATDENNNPIQIAIGLKGYESQTKLKYDWDWGDGSKELGTNKYSNIHTFQLDETKMESRRKTFTVNVTVSGTKNDGTVIKPTTYTISVRIASKTNIGTDFQTQPNDPAPKTQEWLDAYAKAEGNNGRFDWTTSTPPHTNPDLPAPWNKYQFDTMPDKEDKAWKEALDTTALFKDKRLVLSKTDNEKVHFGGRTFMSFLGDDAQPELYGVWIHKTAWNWKKEELLGIIDHEMTHITQWAETRYNKNSLRSRLWAYLYEKVGKEQKSHPDWLIGHFNHAYIYFDYGLASDKFSFKFLNEQGTAQWFIKSFKQAYDGLIQGKVIKFPPETYEVQAIINEPHIDLEQDNIGKGLKQEVKNSLIDLYKTAIKQFPELQDQTEFKEDLQLIYPK